MADQKRLPEEQTGGKTNLQSGGSDCPFKSPNIASVELGKRGESVVFSDFHDDVDLHINRFSSQVSLRVTTKDAPSPTLYVKIEFQPGDLKPAWVASFRLKSEELSQVKTLDINANKASGMFKLGAAAGDRYRFRISFESGFPETDKTIITPWITIKRQLFYAVAHMKQADGSLPAFGKGFDFSQIEATFAKSYCIDLVKIGECEVPFMVNVAPKQHEKATFGLHPTCPIDLAHSGKKPDFFLNFVSHLFDPMKDLEEGQDECVDRYSVTDKAVDVLLTEADSQLVRSCDQEAPFYQVGFLRPGKNTHYKTKSFSLTSLAWEGNRCRVKLSITSGETLDVTRPDNLLFIIQGLQSVKGMVRSKRSAVFIGTATIKDSVGNGDPTPKMISTLKHEMCHLFGLVPSKLPDGKPNGKQIPGDHCSVEPPPCLMHKEDPDAQELCETCLALLMVRPLRKLPIENFNSFSEY